MNSGHRIWCPSTAAYPTPVCHQCRVHSPSVHVSMCGVFRRVQLGFGPTECKAARRVARNMAPEDNYCDALHRAPKCSKSRPHNPSCSTSLPTNHLKGYKQQHDPERWVAPSRQVYPPARKMPRHSQRIHRWWRDWPTRLLWSHVASPKIRKKKNYAIPCFGEEERSDGHACVQMCLARPDVILITLVACRRASYTSLFHLCQAAKADAPDWSTFVLGMSISFFEVVCANLAR